MKKGLIIAIIVIVLLAGVGTTLFLTGVLDRFFVDEISSDEVNDFLSDADNFNQTGLSAEYDRFGIESSQSTVNGSGASADDLLIWKDSDAGGVRQWLRQVEGSVSVEYEFVKRGNVVNFREANTWFYTRDEVPDFTDPFGPDAEIELVTAATGNEYSTRVWEVTLEDHRGYTAHRATSHNGTHDTTLYIQDEPRRLLTLEDEAQDSTSTWVLELVYDDEVEIEVSTSHVRAGVELELNQDDDFDHSGGIHTFWGEVTQNQTQEANEDEIELRVVLDDNDPQTDPDENTIVLVGMYLNESVGNATNYTNITDVDGDLWQIRWNDNDNNSLLSAGDNWTVMTNKSNYSLYTIAFFDHWAGFYARTIPGFQTFFAVLALAGVAVVLAAKKGVFSDIGSQTS